MAAEFDEALYDQQQRGVRLVTGKTAEMGETAETGKTGETAERGKG